MKKELTEAATIFLNEDEIPGDFVCDVCEVVIPEHELEEVNDE